MTTKSWANVTPQLLYDLLLEGRSYGSIASEYSVSRSVVGGQVLRWKQGNKFPAELPKFAKGRPRMAGSTATPRASARTVRKKAVHDSAPKESYDDLVSNPRQRTLPAPTNEPVSIMELGSGMCAVLVSEDPILYCGCEPLANLKFRMCAYHEEHMVSRLEGRPKSKKLGIRR